MEKPFETETAFQNNFSPLALFYCKCTVYCCYGVYSYYDCHSHFNFDTGTKGSTQSSETSSSGLGAIVGGATSGALLLLCAIIMTVVVVYLFLKWRSKSRVKRLQMGIFAM